MNVVVINFTHS